jgi:hypothetical protein
VAYGTLSLADLQRTALNSVVASVGLDITFQALGRTLEEHNAQMVEMLGTFVERTTDRLRRYGGVNTMAMEPADEFGVPRAQKVTAGANVGFPLGAYVGGLQWTEMWFRKHTIAELAAQVDAMLTADRTRVMNEVRRAIYTSTNATSVPDDLVDGVLLDVKRLANADGDPLPAGPNGESFNGSTHTHYIARASTLASTDLDALITTVKEHQSGGEILVYINQSNEAAVRAFTGFVAYLDARLVPATTTVNAPGRSLDLINFNSRAIGLYNGAEVWVKPWILANYPIVWSTAAEKPVCYRYDPDYGDGLFLLNPSTMQPYPGNVLAYPYNVQIRRRIFGCGVWNRVAAAVGYWGDTTYAAPTIA